MLRDKYLGVTLPFQKTELKNYIRFTQKHGLKENRMRNYRVLFIFLRYIVDASYKLGSMSQN